MITHMCTPTCIDACAQRIFMLTHSCFRMRMSTHNCICAPCKYAQMRKPMCMCACIHTCHRPPTHAFMHACIIHAHASVRIRMRACMCACTHERMPYMHTHTFTHSCITVFMHTRMHAFAHTPQLTLMRTHTGVRTWTAIGTLVHHVLHNLGACTWATHVCINMHVRKHPHA